MTTVDITHEQRVKILQHIGIATLAAVSSGRARAVPSGVEIPAGGAYHVRVEPDTSGTYTVTRIYRSSVDHQRGRREHVTRGQLSTMVLRASRYHIYNHEQWVR